MQHVPDCGRRKSLRDVADPWTATEVDGPTARALVKLLVTRADPVTGVTVLTEVLVCEHPREQAPLSLCEYTGLTQAFSKLVVLFILWEKASGSHH